MHGCFALFLALKSFPNEPQNGQKKEEHTVFFFNIHPAKVGKEWVSKRCWAAEKIKKNSTRIKIVHQSEHMKKHHNQRVNKNELVNLF